MGTVVLPGKISSLLVARCVYVDVDKEVKLFFLSVRCVYHAMFAFHT